MSYTLAIKNNETGEVREHKEDGTWLDEEFLWTEGGWACDCNRSLFFSMASGEEPEGSDPCGSSKYSILHVTLPCGTQEEVEPE